MVYLISQVLWNAKLALTSNSLHVRVHDSMYRMVGLARLDAILDLPFKMRG